MGDNWEDLQHQLHYFDYVLVVGILGGAIYLLMRQRRRRREAPDTALAEE